MHLLPTDYAQTDPGDERWRQLDVDVGPQVIAVHPDIGVILEIRITFEQAVLHGVTQIDKITHLFGSSADIDVVYRLERVLPQDLVHPVDVRIVVGIGSVVVFQDLLGLVGRSLVIVDPGLVPQFGKFPRIDEVGEAHARQTGEFRAEGHDRRSHLALTGGDDDHTVGAPNSVNGRSRGILQEGDAFDLGHVQRVKVSFDAVNDHDGRIVAPCAQSPDIKIGLILSGLAADLPADEAGNLADQRLRDGRSGYALELLHVNGIHGTHHAHFFLDAIADHHHLFETLGVRFQHDGLMAVELLYRNLLGIESDKRKYQNVARGGRNQEISVGVARRTFLGLALDGHGDSDHRRTVGIDDLAGDLCGHRNGCKQHQTADEHRKQRHERLRPLAILSNSHIRI